MRDEEKNNCKINQVNSTTLQYLGTPHDRLCSLYLVCIVCILNSLYFVKFVFCVVFIVCILYSLNSLYRLYFLFCISGRIYLIEMFAHGGHGGWRDSKGGSLCLHHQGNQPGDQLNIKGCQNIFQD